MRYRFAVEGIDTEIGNSLEVGSVKMDEPSYPVTLGNNWQLDSVIGKATELRREDNGELTAEIEWHEKMSEELIAKINTEMFLTIYANKIDDERIAARKRLVKSCELRAIFIALDMEDPWATSEDEAHDG